MWNTQETSFPWKQPLEQITQTKRKLTWNSIILAQRCTTQEMQSVEPSLVIINQSLLWWWMQSPFSSQSAPEWTSTSTKGTTESLWHNVEQTHTHRTQIQGNLIKKKKQQLTTKSRPRQSTSAGTPLWGLQVFLGYRTSLRGKKKQRNVTQLQSLIKLNHKEHTVHSQCRLQSSTVTCVGCNFKFSF